ncbi:phosphatidylcholine transfer protein isoform X2 [Dermochelys coriacea]|uniref:phosphatidylcholine transfer protein isoform X2 n=1 Tax=Dermochelys coriacea TaxID=27794 RepID=UPI0018E72224|nr:phosphatidylcholine transfer protein isoform X2 [Dermochelys coriacea]
MEAQPGFSEERFQAACRELSQPAPAPGGAWQLLVETMGIGIYRLYHEQSGLYEYKIFGGLADCPPELLADVYMDLDYRKQWDQYVKELCEKIYDEKRIIYWEVKYPFPLSNRDYVYIRERRDMEVDGRKIWVMLAKSTSLPQCPEKPGIIRVNSYVQSLVLESDGKTGSKVYMYYFDNPGGMIPSWLINWAAKSGVSAFLKDLQKACFNYCKKT